MRWYKIDVYTWYTKIERINHTCTHSQAHNVRSGLGMRRSDGSITHSIIRNEAAAINSKVHVRIRNIESLSNCFRSDFLLFGGGGGGGEAGNNEDP